MFVPGSRAGFGEGFVERKSSAFFFFQKFDLPTLVHKYKEKNEANK
jgi:hypothetical protein